MKKIITISTNDALLIMSGLSLLSVKYSSDLHDSVDISSDQEDKLLSDLDRIDEMIMHLQKVFF